MAKDDLEELQLYILGRINFVYADLKAHPQIKMTFKGGSGSDVEKLDKYVESLTSIEKSKFLNKFREYLKYDAITECKMMFIINNLFALLIKSRNNQISIYENDKIDKDMLTSFAQENADTLTKIKNIRDKISAHIDLDWVNYNKTIELEEIGRCINFLNGLLGIDAEDYR